MVQTIEQHLGRQQVKVVLSHQFYVETAGWAKGLLEILSAA